MSAPEREWLEIGEEYTGEAGNRPRVEAAIKRLDWLEVFEGMEMPFSPGAAIQEAIKQLELPKVTEIAHNGYIYWPDGPETATYSIYGIEANYKNGRARLYVLDSGVDITPLATDFWPVEALV